MIHCTSVVQSKTLVELGLNPATADMSYCPVIDKRGEYTLSANEYKHYNDNSHIPAWSLGGLLSLIKFPKLEYIKTLGTYTWVCIAYYEDSYKDLCMVSKTGGIPIYAVFEMVSYLLKKHYIDDEYILF